MKFKITFCRNFQDHSRNKNIKSHLLNSKRRISQHLIISLVSAIIIFHEADFGLKFSAPARALSTAPANFLSGRKKSQKRQIQTANHNNANSSYSRPFYSRSFNKNVYFLLLTPKSLFNNLFVSLTLSHSPAIVIKRNSK
jgi:hypothetical protein